MQRLLCFLVPLQCTNAVLYLISQSYQYHDLFLSGFTQEPSVQALSI